ncbi:hypothetical protein MKZ38_003680 [Zalerion maritima]|uniref:Uncharacterized protein n=1 Tax=Zalerion maritima TaxID=339359 RepID=A0AAD5RNS9_9PEZI|nr:hypothetical protein MKZ38_003680 [Zalerion maritima]
MDGHAYRLGPRVPVFPNLDESPALALPREYSSGDNPIDLPPSRVMPRDSSSTSDSSNSATCTAGTADLCEKPASSATLTIPIVLGVAIPLLGVAVVLLYLHRRSTLRMRKEDNDDPHRSLDFGMGEGKKRKSAFFGGKEKDPKHRAQLSMDMNLSSPYLLPPQVQGSRDSLHSLARTLKKDDPYGPVDDVSSIKSGRPGVNRKNTDGLSVYTSSSGGRSRTGTFTNAPPRQNSLPQSYVSTGSPLGNSPPHGNPFEAHTIQEDSLTSMPSPPTAAVMPNGRPPTLQERHPDHSGHPNQIEISLYPEDNTRASGRIMPEASLVPEPPQAAMANPNPYARSPNPNETGFDFQLPVQSNAYEFDDQPAPLSRAPQRQSPQDLGLLDPPASNAAPLPQRKASLPTEPQIQYPEESDYDSYNPVPEEMYEEEEYLGRGRHPSRRSNMMGNDGGLAIPVQDNKRLSIGVRPLPPSEVMETEDPERRADRIRSFYKEYFDDSKRDSAVPPVPNMPFQSGRDTQGTEYYEDYDQDYLGDTAFFDPDSNAFVMPYAEPVTRRAMTPPPRGRVPGGPMRGPRPHAGSIGGMSLGGMRGPPGPRGPYPRGGSAMSARFRGPPSMPGSAPGSRAGSRAGMPRKPMPPPAALNTLPTPSKLRDDSFALLASIDFAPPDTFAERAAGRSQSPTGERRPYQLKVPVASPLSTTYDEMAALPSPHLLRKSGTFTALNFAPPKKFKDSDTMSDAGSIRSNRTGISVANEYAIRSGAGRVSKLPGDAVFTQAALGDQLKPQWGMRP